MRVVKACYINISKNKDDYSIVHLPNAPDQYIISWYNEEFLDSSKLDDRFDELSIYNWAEEKTDANVTYFDECEGYSLVKWQDPEDPDNFSYIIQENITKSQLFMDILNLGPDHEKFGKHGADELAQWLFNEV